MNPQQQNDTITLTDATPFGSPVIPVASVASSAPQVSTIIPSPSYPEAPGAPRKPLLAKNVYDEPLTDEAIRELVL